MTLCLLLTLSTLMPAAGTAVRVGLVQRWSAVAAVTVTAPAGAALAGPDGRAVAHGPAVWRFEVKGGDVVAATDQGAHLGRAPVWRVTPAAPDGVVRATASGSRSPASGYRGVLEVRRSGTTGALVVVNEVPLEAYLRGVVPREMSPSAPAEALRAQAIVARSYALAGRGRYRAQGYDLTDTTMSQAYGGADAEKPATDAAVRDTEGLVLLRGGAVFPGDYYADCGGATSDGERDGDYPPSVIDAPPGGPDYCSAGPHHAWTLRVPAGDVVRAAGKDLGELRNIAVAERDTSGRARTVRLEGERGEVAVRGYRLRAALGYDRLRSTWFNVSRADDGTVTFTGRGWGHGHGMCQQGAVGMASTPHSRVFRDILAHYFPGSTVGPAAR